MKLLSASSVKLMNLVNSFFDRIDCWTRFYTLFSLCWYIPLRFLIHRNFVNNDVIYLSAAAFLVDSCTKLSQGLSRFKATVLALVFLLCKHFSERDFSFCFQSDYSLFSLSRLVKDFGALSSITFFLGSIRKSRCHSSALNLSGISVAHPLSFVLCLNLLASSPLYLVCSNLFFKMV